MRECVTVRHQRHLPLSRVDGNWGLPPAVAAGWRSLPSRSTFIRFNEIGRVSAWFLFYRSAASRRFFCLNYFHFFSSSLLLIVAAAALKTFFYIRI